MSRLAATIRAGGRGCNPAVFGWLVMSATVAGCALDPFTAPSPARDRLVAEERTLAAGAHYPDDDAPPVHADPAGAYVEAGVLWVWARSHRRQRGVRLIGGEETAPRPGPRATSRCVVRRAAANDTTYCVGTRQRRGIIAFGAPHFRPQLPDRGGFVDVALDDRRGQLLVADGVTGLIWVLDEAGAVAGQHQGPQNLRAIGLLGDDHVYALAWTAPRLQVLPWPPDPARSPIDVPLSVPWRDAAYDPARRVLWAVGPEQARVRRAEGPIRHLRSVVSAHPMARLLAGDPSPTERYDLAERGLVDATHVSVAGPDVVVSASGSDALWVGPDAPTVVPAGRLPLGHAPLPGGGWAVVNRLDDSVQRFDAARRAVDTIVLDDRPRDQPRDIGERLFYGVGLWETPTADAYTCNSCHWDAGSDHRLQPGFRERRWEMTRPLGGIGMVSPIFSTGGAEALTDAVEGLIRGLDARVWHGPSSDAWWLAPKSVTLDGGALLSIEAEAVRRALLTFLMALPAEPGPLRGVVSPTADKGGRLFARDCALCHEPVRDMRRRDRVPASAVADTLRERPLAFGGSSWVQSGAAPYYTPYGNRVTPLVNLSRGGPFFTDGSAATLAEVVRRTRPGSRQVHGDGPGRRYTATEAAQLIAWLRAL